MDINEIERDVIEMRSQLSSHEEKFNSFSSLHEECKKLQKERLDNTTSELADLNSAFNKFQENFISRFYRFRDETKKRDVEVTAIMDKIQTNLNIAMSDVNDVLDYKKKIDDRITKLVLAIVTAVLVSLAVKGVDRLIPDHHVDHQPAKTEERSDVR